MVWKPKEKELTKEEAVELARKELQPYWHGSSPLLAGVTTAQGPTAFPLDPEFFKKPWLVTVIDPSTFTGRNVLEFVREMERRFRPQQQLTPLLILKKSYSFFTELKNIEGLIRSESIQFPLVVDHDGMLVKAFKVTQTPAVALVSEGKVEWLRQGEGWYKGIEADLHLFFRKDDPGLPLLPVWTTPESYRLELPGLEFGQGRVDAKRVKMSGSWKFETECATPVDNDATVEFQLSGEALSLIARVTKISPEPAKIVFELSGAPAYDMYSGGDLDFDDEGQSLVRVEGPKIYSVLQGVPAKFRSVTMRFPNANRVPLSLYGLRMGK